MLMQDLDPNVLQEIKITAQRIYPGRSYDSLSEDERKNLFRAYKAERQQATGMINTPMPEGRQAGNVYTAANPLEFLGAIAQQATGAYQMRQTNKREASGRQTAAALQTRESALNREAENQRYAREEQRRREWLSGILGR